LSGGTRLPSVAEEGLRRFIVWGDNALARRLVSELMVSYGAQVTVIVSDLEEGQSPEIAAMRPDPDDPDLAPTVIAARRLTTDVFTAAGISSAAALALVAQDDVDNVDAALIAREVNPAVRLVLRMFNPVLGDGVGEMLGDCAVLSASEIAAPAFVSAVLGDEAPTYIRLPDQLLVVGSREEFDDADDPNDVVAGIAITRGLTTPITLPENESAADVVLSRVYGSRTPPPPRTHRQRRHPLRTARLIFGRNVALVLGGLSVLLLIGTIALAIIRHSNLWQAFYLTLLTALSGANPDLGTSTAEQVIDVVLVVASIAVIPALTASVVEGVVRARLAIAAGGLTEPIANHVIVVGLGNVGTRVVQELHGFGVDVVAIDRDDRARGVQVARELGIPVLIRDANTVGALRAASVETCRALMVLSTDDVTNLETALLGRTVYRNAGDTPRRLRVVLRLFDEDFAGRVKRAFDITISRSVSYLAAPAFASAMVGREVIDTISVGRRVLLVAELPVGAGSEVEGQFCPDIDRPHEVRLMAVRTGRGAQTLWSLPRNRPLRRTDRLLVVATRAGLAALSARVAGVPNPPPLPAEPDRFPILTQRDPRSRDRGTTP
jgi:Trk K+ transport system NAD-binding subunit